MKKDLNYYQNLRYAVRIEPDPKQGFVASIPDLPGCLAYGETEAEALEDLEDSKELWLETYVEAHGEAPEPKTAKTYSGKLLLRLPKSLHRSLDEVAQEEGTSLNQHIVCVLSEQTGRNTALKGAANGAELATCYLPGVTLFNEVTLQNSYVFYLSGEPSGRTSFLWNKFELPVNAGWEDSQNIESQCYLGNLVSEE